MTTPTTPTSSSRGRTRRRAAATVAVAVAVLALPACGAARGGDTVAQGPAVAGPDRAEVGATPAAEAGSTPVVVPIPGQATVAFFFAVGCVDCLPAAKAVAEAAKTAPEGVSYVAVNMLPGETPDSLKSFLAEAGAQGMKLMVDGAEPVTLHRVMALSTTIVFDSTGKETFRGVAASAATIEEAVTAAQQAAR